MTRIGGPVRRTAPSRVANHAAVNVTAIRHVFASRICKSHAAGPAVARCVRVAAIGIDEAGILRPGWRAALALLTNHRTETTTAVVAYKVGASSRAKFDTAGPTLANGILIAAVFGIVTGILSPVRRAAFSILTERHGPALLATMRTLRAAGFSQLQTAGVVNAPRRVAAAVRRSEANVSQRFAAFGGFAVGPRSLGFTGGGLART